MVHTVNSTGRVEGRNARDRGRLLRSDEVDDFLGGALEGCKMLLVQSYAGPGGQRDGGLTEDDGIRREGGKVRVKLLWPS